MSTGEKRRDLLEQEWHCVESFHLPPETCTYIIAGHWDPHVGTPVADFADVWMLVEDGKYDDEEDAIAAGNAVMNHICELHNAWLREKKAPHPPAEGG